MLIRATIRNWRFTITAARVAKIIGVNSTLPDGTHILMWDFDDVELGKVKEALYEVQSIYKLSDIHIVNSGKPDHFLAYCFSSQLWRRAVEVVVRTRYVDWQFFRFGVYRGHFTLRVTPKAESTPVFVCKLPSEVVPDCNPTNLLSWVRYETLSWR